MKKLSALTFATLISLSSTVHGMLNRNEIRPKETRLGKSSALPRNESVIKLLGKKPEREKILASAFIGNGMVTLTTRRLLWLPTNLEERRAEIELGVSKSGKNICGSVLLMPDEKEIRAVALVNEDFETGQLTAVVYVLQKDGTITPLARPLNAHNIKAKKITECVLNDSTGAFEDSENTGEDENNGNSNPETLNLNFEEQGIKLSIKTKTEK